MIEQFLMEIEKIDPLQYKYLLSAIRQLNPEEETTLRHILHFFQINYGNVKELAEAYLLIVDDFREETKYFLEHGKYRNNSYKEVSELVYFNDRYMEKYMIGLVLSDYIWLHHIKISRWFREHLSGLSGEQYLEIGPGFGNYFLTAINNTDFKSYSAMDISPKSVEGTTKFINHFCNIPQKNWSVNCMNFLEYNNNALFDCIVMGEVLEHLENPAIFLNKIYSLLADGGNCFISTVINAPAIDHIFLYSSVDEVLNMIIEAGFKVVDYLCTTENDLPLQKALKRKRSIIIIMKLTK